MEGGRNEKQGKERRGEETREWVDESVLFSSGLISWGVKEMWAHMALASHFKNDRWKLGMEVHTLIPTLGVRSQLVLYSEFQDDQVEGNRWCPGKGTLIDSTMLKNWKPWFASIYFWGHAITNGNGIRCWQSSGCAGALSLLTAVELLFPECRHSGVFISYNFNSFVFDLVGAIVGPQFFPQSL